MQKAALLILMLVLISGCNGYLNSPNYEKCMKDMEEKLPSYLYRERHHMCMRYVEVKMPTNG